MKSRNRKKIVLLIISIYLFVFALISKPFIECNSIDSSIYRKCLLVISTSILISSIVNITKKKKRSIISFIIVVIGIISSFVIYSGHSNDYKIRCKNYFKSLLNIDKKVSNNSVSSVSSEVVNSDTLEGELLKVNFIDVGQGDSIFVELPNEETMLIDAGEINQSNRVISYIDNLGYNKIDYVVGTHPHTDHIGGVASVIKNYDIGSIYMPKKHSNSKTFINLLNTIKDKGLKINTAKAGVNIINKDNLNVDIIAPDKEYSDSNNNSVVVKITYINRCFLFMGDAEVDSEKNITDNVECDVVKIGHHGSDTASSDTFVKKTKAKYAVISVGKGNIYKHPYESTIKKWESIGAEILRTDELGSIVISTNGSELSINNKLVNYVDNSNNTNNSDIEIINVDIKKGNDSIIKIKGNPNTEYDIKVYYKSGISTSKELVSKKTDSQGYIEWRWKVPNNVKRGMYKFTINNNEFEYELR